MQLSVWLKKTGLPLSLFADRIKVSRQSVSAWLRGAKPHWRNMNKVRRATSGAVQREDWQ
jgi:transcriptional regulator with XRE-family HTH domain